MTLLKRNIIASYAGQIYTTLIGIALVPMYLKYMGTETYGLVGFYAMLQAWFVLLDMGLTPTMSREAARFHGGAVDALSMQRLLRALEGIFLAVALAGACAMIAGSGLIAGHWLKVQQLPVHEVQHALILIGIIIALHWVGDLYRGVINGFEQLVWLNIINASIATLRFVLVIPFFIYVGARPVQFFGYQLALSICEVTLLVIKTYRLLPRLRGQRHLWDWRPLRGVLHFSLAMGFASSAWLIVTQTDKLILSRLLPLTQYAYFTLAVLVASGVMVISTPISGALMPRLVTLNALGDEAGLVRLYHDATQMMAVIVIPATLVLALCAEQVLWLWTGDPEIARRAAPVLTLYALGNGLLALSAFPYYLQYAKGDLKLHLIGSAFFLTMLIPPLVWATARFGVIGAGYSWLGANAVYLVVWVPIVHRRFVKGLHRVWLMRDLAGIALFTTFCAAVMRQYVKWPVDRAPTGILVLSLGAGLLVVAAVASSWVREMIASMWRARVARAIS